MHGATPQDHQRPIDPEIGEPDRFGVHNAHDAPVDADVRGVGDTITPGQAPTGRPPSIFFPGTPIRIAAFRARSPESSSDSQAVGGTQFGGSGCRPAVRAGRSEARTRQSAWPVSWRSPGRVTSSCARAVRGHTPLQVARSATCGTTADRRRTGRTSCARFPVQGNVQVCMPSHHPDTRLHEPARLRDTISRGGPPCAPLEPHTTGRSAHTAELDRAPTGTGPAGTPRHDSHLDRSGCPASTTPRPLLRHGTQAHGSRTRHH